MGCSHLSVSISLKSFSTHISSHSSIVLNLLLFPVEQLNNAFATSRGPTHQGNRHIWIVHKSLVLDCNHSGSKNLRRDPAPWVSCKPCQKKWDKKVFDLQKKLDVCKYPFAFWMDTDLIAFLFCFKVVSVSSLKKPNTVQSPKAISKFFAHRSSPPEPAAATVLHIEGPLHHKVSFWASLFGHPANLVDSVRNFV